MSIYSEEKENKKSSKKILTQARLRFDIAVAAYADIRKKALEDLEFRAGEQWPEEIKNARSLEKRPTITINRMPQFIRQITNDQRQNRPAIKVSPVDDDADIDTAKVYQGIIRHIEYNSDADTAYDTAFEGAVIHGFGFYRIITEYISPNSFDQEILIKKIGNAFSVYMDPYAQKPDMSDSNWGFVFEDISSEEYKNQYPDSELTSMEDWSVIGDDRETWLADNKVRLAEYFYKEFKDDTLFLLENGSTVLESEYEDAIKKGIITENDEHKVVKKRPTTTHKVMWCKMNGIEILEQTEWVGSYIPIVPVLGDELIVNGKKILEGIVRHAKDPQRMYNYWASSETETITLAPKAPYVGAAGQFEGHEQQWRTANTKNHAFLQYNPKTLSGHVLPAPQRSVAEPPVMAITNARRQSSDDLKSTTGVYDAAVGNQSNETSGIAIQRRNVQSQTSNFHYIDNLTRSLRHAGRILVEIIPKVYDVAKAQRIIGEDGKNQIVKINQAFESKGKQVFHNLSKGKYDVTIETGPSYNTKRQEATDSMIAMSKSNPKFNEVASDLMVRNMDWPYSDEIADRLKKTLPEGIAKQDDDDEKIELPPQARKQIQDMGQMIEQLTEGLKQANEKLSTDSMKLESNERIAYAKIDADLKKTLFEANASESEIMLKEEINLVNKKIEGLSTPSTAITTGGVSSGNNQGDVL